MNRIQSEQNAYELGYQQGAIEELENIKTKIQGLSLGYQCLGVIEDRISELKGENK